MVEDGGLSIHRRDLFALVHTAEEIAGGFGAIEDQHPGSLVIVGGQLGDQF